MQAPGINPTLTRLGKQIQKPDAENGESRLEHDLHIFRGEFSAGMGKTNPEVVTSTGQGLLSGRQLADSALGSGCIDGDISIGYLPSCNWDIQKINYFYSARVKLQLEPRDCLDIPIAFHDSS